uniref:Putative capsid protein n=1 Tax=viral metagenome TaxID=1070528 RepID=A0A6M3KW95_9ZZZZ
MALVSPLNSAAFRKLLKKDMFEVSEGEYNDLPQQGKELYRTVSTDEATSEFYGVSGLPDIPTFNGKLSYLGRAPGYYTKIEPKEFAAGVITERKFIDDNQWPVLRDHAKELVKSNVRTQEKYRARPFNYAFSTAFDFMQSEENVSLCNDAHLTKSGTSTTYGFDNKGTSALDKTSVATTWLAMRQFRDSMSERIEMSDNYMLIVPDTLGDTAEEIAGTVKGLDMDAGNINPQYGRYKVFRYMRLDDYSTTNWFMCNVDMMKKMLLWIDRISQETDTIVDFETKSVKHSIYSRWGYGWKDWRFLYGHSV